ncbi:MAG: LytR C-terminal domain-containing protein [Corynebacterium sp.]|uniref:LytR C-terminal domain-containing protein n=1 Tax=Corynebacterium sp. TaxID=1720 RepID=UPI0026E0A0A7|nr:LytR C-terminal domain-containing protein [Corynebacterium sp.]MDO5669366.1 LytR C-terminal domain-containing protein [Corynebacterium sp.]
MTHVNPENENEPTTDTPAASGLPLRGLAMVLIAVAVLLVMWGLYAMTQNNDSADQAAPETTAEVVATPEETAAETTEEAPVEEETTAAETTPEEPPAPAPAEEPGRLNVLNNSTVPNLAADVADQLRGDFEVGEVGNMADHILPENTVFFQPGNAEAEQRARELADRVGGVAREYEGFLPDGTDGRNDLTLVLVNQVAL